MKDVISVVGVRGFGLPICRRLGVTGKLLVGDSNAEILENACSVLSGEGYEVTAREIDITNAASTEAFAREAASLGRIRSMVCTAGLSGSMSDPARIFEVNMFGAMNLLDAFTPLVGDGSTAVIIASNAGYMMPFTAEDERILACGTRDEVRALFAVHEAAKTGLGAYCLSKRGNQLRIEARAAEWGDVGARLATVSPGVMSTPMAHFERDAGMPIEQAAASTPMGRFGYPEDIAAAVAWLVGPEATFVTGIDLRVDGGMTAAQKWG